VNQSKRWAARDRCSIAGVGHTEFSRESGRSELTLAVEACLTALDDAGLERRDVDGIVRCNLDVVRPNELVTALGIPNLTYWGECGPGGTAPCALIGQALGAILSGQATTVVAFRALNGRSGWRPGRPVGQIDHTTGPDPEPVGGQSSYDEYFAPYGLTNPVHFYALLARRHMIEFGTTEEQLGAVAVTSRARANANPNAQMHGRPMSLADYLSSRPIADPLRMFDCCLETDGACAVVVTATDRARDLRKPPVLIAGLTQGSGAAPQGGILFPSLMRETTTASVSSRAIADVLYRRAGLGPGDVDVAQFYDCFTITVLLQLADYGFCEPGDAGPLAASGELQPGGRLPINTSGGHLSEGYLHGFNHLVEGARQIRGESTAQIADAGVCLVTSGPPAAASALLLRKDEAA
jgi:acetyl-CoA acetyltransferase